MYAYCAPWSVESIERDAFLPSMHSIDGCAAAVLLVLPSLPVLV